MARAQPRRLGRAGGAVSRRVLRRALSPDPGYERYSEAELELLVDFVRRGREFNERRAVQVEQQTRSRRGEP